MSASCWPERPSETRLPGRDGHLCLSGVVFSGPQRTLVSSVTVLGLCWIPYLVSEIDIFVPSSGNFNITHEDDVPCTCLTGHTLDGTSLALRVLAGDCGPVAPGRGAWMVPGGSHSTCYHNIITLVHVKVLIVGNTGHFGNEIDSAGSEGDSANERTNDWTDDPEHCEQTVTCIGNGTFTPEPHVGHSVFSVASSRVANRI